MWIRKGGKEKKEKGSNRAEYLGFSFIVRYLASRTFFHFVEPLRSNLADFVGFYVSVRPYNYQPHHENGIGFCMCVRRIVVEVGVVSVIDFINLGFIIS